MTVEAFAGDVERFGSVKRYAAFFGLVPSTKQTGMSGDKTTAKATNSRGIAGIAQEIYAPAAETARRHIPTLQPPTSVCDCARQAPLCSAVIIVAHKLVRRVYAIRGDAQPASLLADRYASLTALSSMRFMPAHIAEHFPSKAVSEMRCLAPRDRRADGNWCPKWVVRKTPPRPSRLRCPHLWRPNIDPTRSGSSTAQLTKTCLTGLRRYRGAMSGEPLHAFRREDTRRSRTQAVCPRSSERPRARLAALGREAHPPREGLTRELPPDGDPIPCTRARALVAPNTYASRRGRKNDHVEHV